MMVHGPGVAVSGVLLQMEEVIRPLIPELLPTLCLFQLDEDFPAYAFHWQLLLPLVRKYMFNYMLEYF